MQCLHCQAEVPDDAVFCDQCGAPFEARCPSCGEANRFRSKFCKKCGRPLAAPKAPETPTPEPPAPESPTSRDRAERNPTPARALEGERKQVTVLFADLKGSLELLANRDPEESRTLLNAVVERMMEAVHRYEGTVNNVMGDGIMATFGAPLAHEDHALRACYAALRMEEAVQRYNTEVQHSRGITVRMRVGLNSGEVVAGSVGDALRMDYTSVGQTTHLAARMEQMAAPGSIMVSGHTHKLAEGFFRFKELGPVQVKGLDAPIDAFELVGVGTLRTRLDVAARRGLVRFVGRRGEMEQLRQALALAQTGRGQILGVMGEPGVGKSRLFYEFKLLGVRECLVLETFARAHGKDHPYLPLTELLKDYFQIRPRDDDRTRLEKMNGKLLELDRGLAQDALPYLGFLLGIAEPDSSLHQMDARLRRQRILDAIKRLLLYESLKRPVCLVFEDLHWIDNETQAFLDRLSESVPSARILLLVNYRPEYQHGWGSKTYYTQLRLDPLGHEDAEALLAALLRDDDASVRLKRPILMKTEGNPFFIEEVVRTLVEEKVLVGEHGNYHLVGPAGALQIPATVQVALAARIDRATPEQKALLQTLAVAGRQFSLSLIGKIVGEPAEELAGLLADLQAGEFIYELPAVPEAEYTFKHALTQEVAYGSLLAERRKDLHRTVGRAIEELYADRLAEQYEVVAHHFLKADETPRALDYLLKAAEKAVKAFANREAIAWYEQALEAATDLGDAVDAKTLLKIHQAKAGLYLVVSDFENAQAEGERLLDLARQTGDRINEGAALAGIGLASAWAHKFNRALDYSRQAIEVCGGSDAQPVLARGHMTTGMVYAVTGQLHHARQEFAEVLNISRSAGDIFHQSFTLGFTGFLKNWEGDYREALQLQTEGLKLAREHNLLVPLLQGLFFHGVTLTGRGDYDAALQIFEEGLVLSDKVGDEINRHRLLNSLGWLHMETGDLDRAMELNREGAEGARKRGDPETIANPEINLGDIFLFQGDLALAQEFLEGVQKLARDPATTDWMKWRYSTHLFASLGELWLARGEYAKAAEFSDHCLDLATRTQSRKNLIKGWRLKGEIALARHRHDEAQSALQRALTIAKEIGNPTQLWKCYLALGRLHEERKTQESARESFRAARQVVDSMKAGLQSPELRTSLESAPMTRRIYELSRL